MKTESPADAPASFAPSRPGGETPEPTSHAPPLRSWLARPVDAASLGMFRILFGACVFWDVWMVLARNGVAASFLGPSFRFVYPLAPVPTLPAGWLYVFFFALAVAAAALTIGLFTRAAAVAVFVGFTYYFLLDEAQYLNHHYLMCLLAFLLIWMPCGRALSVDRLRGRGAGVSNSEPSRLSTPDSRLSQLSTLDSQLPPTVPFWTVALLRFQMLVVYFYAGVAKLNADWLLHGAPLDKWLAPHADFWLIGPYFHEKWMILAIAWGGMLFDLAIGWLLLWRRTRMLGILLAFGFHTMNHFWFNIGVFPFMALGASLIFFDPDWPRRTRLALVLCSLIALHLLLDLVVRPGEAGRFNALGAIALVVFLFVLVGRARPRAVTENPPSFSDKPGAGDGPGTSQPPPRVSMALCAFLVAWAVVHVSLPLRHWLYPGDVHWTEEGHRFSWRMRLRDKDADPASAFFAVRPGNPPPRLSESVERDVPAGPAADEAGWRLHWRLLYPYAAGASPLPLHAALDEATARAFEQRGVELAIQYGLIPEEEQMVRSLGIDPARYLAFLRAEADARPTEQIVVRYVNRYLAHRALQALLQQAVAEARRDQDAVQRAPSPLAGEGWGGGAADAVHRHLRRLGTAFFADLELSVTETELDRLLNASQRFPALQLSPRQYRKMLNRPYMVREYANYVADVIQDVWGVRPAVYADVRASLNGRPFLRLIDPTADLAAEPFSLLPADWIMPLDAEMPSWQERQQQWQALMEALGMQLHVE